MVADNSCHSSSPTQGASSTRSTSFLPENCSCSRIMTSGSGGAASLPEKSIVQSGHGRLLSDREYSSRMLSPQSRLCESGNDLSDGVLLLNEVHTHAKPDFCISSASLCSGQPVTNGNLFATAFLSSLLTCSAFRPNRLLMCSTMVFSTPTSCHGKSSLERKRLRLSNMVSAVSSSSPHRSRRHCSSFQLGLKEERQQQQQHREKWNR